MNPYNADDQVTCYGPCGCCIYTPPPTRRESARALIAILLLGNLAESVVVLYGMAHPGW